MPAGTGWQKIFLQKKYILRGKIHLLPFQPTLWPPSPHTKILKCLKRRFFTFFQEKIKILYFIIILVEIWLVKLKLKFVAFVILKLARFYSKNGQNYVMSCKSERLISVNSILALFLLFMDPKFDFLGEKLVFWPISL